VLLFSTRLGGVSRAPYDALNLGRSTEDDPAAVAENRTRILRCAGLDPSRLATAGQCHGTRVTEVDAPGHHPECDALVTRVPGVALAVTTADCMSMLYSAPGVVAAVHSGWRGTADGMPAAALEAVCRLAGCAPDAVHVAFGPAIRGCCYEVGEEVAARFPAEAVRATPGRPRLDLPTAAALTLRAAGVRTGSLTDTGACTSCEPALYFSHRRDHGRTGRQWGVAACRA
jgi:YfiH family protein